MLKELQGGQLVRLLSDWEMGVAAINVVLPAGRTAKPSARAFTEFFSTELRKQEAIWDRICPACSVAGSSFPKT